MPADTRRSFLQRRGPSGPAEVALAAAVAGCLFLAGWLAAAGLPPWGDEPHHIRTIERFGSGLSAEILRTYEEMATPLAFLAYAAWGKVAGFGVDRLRLFSVVAAAATTAILWSLFARVARNRREALIFFLSAAASPYFLGLGFYIYTDMLALFMLAVALHGYATRRALWIAAGIGGAVLTRQYMALLAPAVILAALVDDSMSRAQRPTVIAAAAAGAACLVPLFMLWDGLSPVSFYRDIYMVDGVRFDPHALSLYLAVPGLYLLPACLWVLVSGRAARDRALIAGAAAAAAAWVALFEVRVTPVQIEQGMTTVGYVHKALARALPPAGVAAVFMAGAALWAAVAAQQLRIAHRAGRLTGLVLLAWTTAAMFLVIMPFAYISWEKYAMPLCMVAALALAGSGPGREKIIEGRPTARALRGRDAETD